MVRQEEQVNGVYLFFLEFPDRLSRTLRQNVAHIIETVLRHLPCAVLIAPAACQLPADLVDLHELPAELTVLLQDLTVHLQELIDPRLELPVILPELIDKLPVLIGLLPELIDKLPELIDLRLEIPVLRLELGVLLAEPNVLRLELGVLLLELGEIRLELGVLLPELNVPLEICSLGETGELSEIRLEIGVLLLELGVLLLELGEIRLELALALALEPASSVLPLAGVVVALALALVSRCGLWNLRVGGIGGSGGEYDQVAHG